MQFVAGQGFIEPEKQEKTNSFGLQNVLTAFYRFFQLKFRFVSMIDVIVSYAVKGARE